MYSKKYGTYMNGDYTVTPPPGYDGSRFGSRSDGRDDSFPPYDTPPQVYAPDRRENNKKEQKECPTSCEHGEDTKKEHENCFFPFMREKIGREELLIISLLIVLISENNISAELVLMLGLLLCI